MPPPPPPSKSYLIRITDSDLSSSEEDNDREDLAVASAVPISSSAQSNVAHPMHFRQASSAEAANIPLATISSLKEADASIPVALELTEDEVQEYRTLPRGEAIGFPVEEASEQKLASVEGDSKTPALSGRTQKTSTSSTIASCSEHEVDDEEFDQDGGHVPTDDEAVVGGKRNRKRKKKKKKKKGKGGASVASSPRCAVTIDSPQQQKQKVSSRRVSFGQVHVKEFERCLGTSVVPGDGGWPLGLGKVVVASADDGDQLKGKDLMTPSAGIDEYEQRKHARLAERWKELVLSNSETKDGSTDNFVSSSPPEVLETRQWDYLAKGKNPLFRMMTEKQRMKLLLGEPDDHYDDNSERHGYKNGQAAGKKSKERGHSHKGNHQRGGRHGGGRPRTLSGSKKEQFNEQFTEHDVHLLRNELEQLRNHRSSSSQGCSCRRLEVFIPPPNSGKKAAHRRLSLARVKDELRKRGRLPFESKTREQLELLLRDIVETEPCCGQDCRCVLEGITCQADVCSCWHDSHQQKGKKPTLGGDILSPTEISLRCGNSFGMYTVDIDAIQNYRIKQLQTVCIPVPQE